MAYEIGTALGHFDLITKLKTFLESTLPVGARWTALRTTQRTLGTVSSITRSGTTATVTMTSVHGLQSTESVVIGGASDALYNGTFTVTVTSTTVFTYTMSGTPAANASGTLTAGRNAEVIWVAPGLSSTDQIYTGLYAYESIPSDYYNLSVSFMTGYVPGNTFGAQPGGGAGYGVPMWNQTIPYWFVGNAQRVIVFVKIQNNYNSFYLGKFLPYATPGQYPYPVCVGGMLTSASGTRYSDTSYTSWWKGGSTIVIRPVNGIPINVEIPAYSTNTFRNTINSSNTAAGYYGLHPLILSDTSPNVYGELDGVYMISGFDNATENTIVVGGVTYVILRNVTRTGISEYVALKLA